MADRYDEELFLGYVEGDLTPEQTHEFEKLLVEDARLRNLVAQLVIDRHRLRNLPVEEAPADLMEPVNQTLERHMLLGESSAESNSYAAPAKTFRLKRTLAYASIAAVIAVGATLVVRTLTNPAVQNLALTQRPTPTSPMAAKPAAPATSPLPGPLADARSASGRQGGRAHGEIAGEPPLAAPAANDHPTELEMLRGHTDADHANAPAAMPPLAMATPDGGSDSRRRNEAPADSEDLKRERGETTIASADHKEKAAADGAARALSHPTPSTPLSPAEAATPAAPPAAAAGAAAGGVAPLADTLASRNADSFRDKDVPVPAAANNGPVLESHSARIEITSAFPAATERDLKEWAEKNHVTEAPGETSTDTVDMAKTERYEAGAKKDQVNGPTQVILMLESRQVSELMAHLNSQRGQTAALTRAAATPQVIGAAHRGLEEIQSSALAANSKAQIAAEKAAATQPSTQPAATGETAAIDSPRQLAQPLSKAAAAPESGAATSGKQAAARVALPPDGGLIAPDPHTPIRLPVIIEQAKPDR